MWDQNWRHECWQQIEQKKWDVVIIGGGITGAGIFREAVRLGLKVLLIEQRDFAWGTSSRSSKLVHGGLRYLKQGKIDMTLASVQERDQLLAEGPGLIDPLGFLLATYEGDSTSSFVLQAGLTIYDLLALQWSHRSYSPADFKMMAPHVDMRGLQGGFRYGDAQTDDARLVLRVILEAVADGDENKNAMALNYVRAVTLVREAEQVRGVILQDTLTERQATIEAGLVINATGAWADALRQQVGGAKKIRPLRGSHLIFPSWRVPVAQAISFSHPMDGRPVFLFPWEGVTLAGTTDRDHPGDLNQEPAISPEEVAYLMAGLEDILPSLNLSLKDITATFAGVRPIISSGQEDPSKEARDHVVWEENGLLTVTGGKLTTFRVIARDALKAAQHLLPQIPDFDKDKPVLDPVQELPLTEGLDEPARRRLLGRYGRCAADLLAAAQPDELEPIPGTYVLWAELRWSARAEGVAHLDDLLLRRVRLGLLLPEGGKAHLPRIRAICQTELGWSDARWLQEEATYLQLCRTCYSLPPAESIPNWREMLQEAQAAKWQKLAEKKAGQRPLPWGWVVGGVATLAGYWLWRRKKG